MRWVLMVFRSFGADPSVREFNTMTLRPTIPNDFPDETARTAQTGARGWWRSASALVAWKRFSR